MEKQPEDMMENRHFEIREKIQTKLILDYYSFRNPSEVNNEQAFAWINSHARVFDASFEEVVHEYPSFWNDAEQDLEKAEELVKQKMVEQESRLSI